MRRFIQWLLLLTVPLQAASELTGTVVDQRTHKPLVGANILLENSSRGVLTDQNGRFRITGLAEGNYPIVVSYIGYESVRQKVMVKNDTMTVVHFSLSSMLLNYSEVVITSTKLDKELRDVALPLTVVREEQIERQAPITIANALQKEAGISMGRDGVWGTVVNIRGLARNHVVTLVDGNRIDTANDLAAGQSLIDVNDIQRIEVIKGAASSLYGSGAMGGVVNLITKGGWYQDQPYLKAQAMGGYTSVNNSGMGKLSANVGHQRWYVYATWMQRKADDARTPAGMLNSQYKDKSLSTRIGLRLWTNHEVKLSYQRYLANDVGMPGGYPIFPDNADVRYPKEERELYSMEYQMQKLSTRWVKTSFRYFYQYILRDVENIPHMVNNLPAAGGQPARRVSVLKISPGATHDTHGIQWQNDFSLGVNRYLIWGLDGWQKDYRGYRSKQTQIEVLSPVNNTVVRTTSKTIGELPLPDAYYRSLGLFGQYEQYAMQKRLQLTLGGRYDKVQIENKEGLNPLYEIIDGIRNDAPNGQVVLWPAEKASDHSWSTNLGLLFRLTPWLDLTGNVARAFRSPYLEERYQYVDLGNLVKLGDPNLKPENGNFYDLGFRLVNGSATVTGNIFYNRLLNMVTETPGKYEGRNALIKANIGKAELMGGEFRSSLTLLEWLSVGLSASHVKGRDLILQQPLPQIPAFHAGATVQVQVGKLGTCDVSATSYAAQNQVAEGEFKTSGYTFFDLYFNSHPFHLSSLAGRILLGIENIGDKTYRNHLATNRGLITAEPGRNVLVRYQMEW